MTSSPLPPSTRSSPPRLRTRSSPSLAKIRVLCGGTGEVILTVGSHDRQNGVVTAVCDQILDALILGRSGIRLRERGIREVCREIFGQCVLLEAVVGEPASAGAGRHVVCRQITGDRSTRLANAGLAAMYSANRKPSGRLNPPGALGFAPPIRKLSVTMRIAAGASATTSPSATMTAITCSFSSTSETERTRSPAGRVRS